MKKNIVFALVALVAGLLGSGTAGAQEVTCSGSGGTNCSGTIPDFPIATPFTSTLTVAQPFSCGASQFGVGIRVNLVHTRIGDLRISVTGPSGTTTLLDQPTGSGGAGGCAGQDIQAVFGTQGPAANSSCQEITIPAISGNVTASGPGTAFLQSTNVTGAWQLTVTDLSNGSEGFVQDWSVMALCGAPTAIPTQSTMGLLMTMLMVFALGIWGLAGRRRL